MMQSKYKPYGVAMLVVLALALAACAPAPSTTETASTEPSSPSATPGITSTPAPADCQPPIAAGTWSGSAAISAEGFLQNAHFQMPNGMNINVPNAKVLTQQGQSQLVLNVGCDGSVTGVASITTTAQVGYKLAGLLSLIDAECTAQADSNLSGQVVAATDGSGQPILNLTGTVTQGTNQCTWTSSIPGVESGSFTDDLSGTTAALSVTVEQVSENAIGGAQWAGSDLQALVDKYIALAKQAAQESGQDVDFDFSVNYTTPWQLQRQP